MVGPIQGMTFPPISTSGVMRMETVTLTIPTMHVLLHLTVL